MTLERKLVAVATALAVFWLLSLGISAALFGLHIFDVIADRGHYYLTGRSPLTYMLVMRSPLMLSNAVGALAGGIAGVMVLKERRYLILALPMALLDSLSIFVYLKDGMTESGESYLVCLAMDVVLVFILCTLGAWVVGGFFYREKEGRLNSGFVP